MQQTYFLIRKGLKFKFSLFFIVTDLETFNWKVKRNQIRRNYFCIYWEALLKILPKKQFNEFRDDEICMCLRLQPETETFVPLNKMQSPSGKVHDFDFSLNRWTKWQRFMLGRSNSAPEEPSKLLSDFLKQNDCENALKVGWALLINYLIANSVTNSPWSPWLGKIKYF